MLTPASIADYSLCYQQYHHQTNHICENAFCWYTIEIFKNNRSWSIHLVNFTFFYLRDFFF